MGAHNNQKPQGTQPEHRRFAVKIKPFHICPNRILDTYSSYPCLPIFEKAPAWLEYGCALLHVVGKREFILSRSFVLWRAFVLS